MAGKVPFVVKIPRPKTAAGGALHEAAKDGFIAIMEAFQEFCDDLEEVVLPSVMVAALEPTLQLSQVYVPVDTGELKESGYLEEVRRGKGSARAEIGYGKNGQAPYALYVHEMTDIPHKAPTSAKYLERAIDEDYFAILNRIVKGVKESTGL